MVWRRKYKSTRKTLVWINLSSDEFCSVGIAQIKLIAPFRWDEEEELVYHLPAVHGRHADPHQEDPAAGRGRRQAGGAGAERGVRLEGGGVPLPLPHLRAPAPTALQGRVPREYHPAGYLTH